MWTSNLGLNILIFFDFIEPENILSKITKSRKRAMQAASIATIFAKACKLWEICYFLVIYLDLVSRRFSSRMRNTYDFFSLSFSLHTGSPSRKVRDQHAAWRVGRDGKLVCRPYFFASGQICSYALNPGQELASSHFFSVLICVQCTLLNYNMKLSIRLFSSHPKGSVIPEVVELCWTVQ